jgi:hypothetical protein
MNADEKRVIEFGHSADAVAPLSERIAIYRSLARTTARPRIAAHFFGCADELAAAEARIGQMLLDLSDGPGGDQGNGVAP